MKIHLEGKALQKVNKRIRDRNRRFRAKTKQQQRLAVIKDAINQLKAGKFIAASTYFEFPASTANAIYWANNRREDRSAVELCSLVEQAKCEVCGIGSLFVSAVRLDDQFKIYPVAGVNRSQEVRKLTPWFDRKQLDLIETHYEGGKGGASDNSWYASHRYSKVVGGKETPKKRLLMILENMLSNNGKFNPHKGAHKVEK